MDEFQKNYIESATLEFHRYKTLGDKTFQQLSEEELHWKYSETDNCIALIVKHISGNMLSRWTNFLVEDGEKPWRDRENEFTKLPKTKNDLIQLWETGWECLFKALNSINKGNFQLRIKIRNEPHTISEAVNRQLAHYANHAGQIVFIGKMIKGKAWVSPSIPRGDSKFFNKEIFGK